MKSNHARVIYALAAMLIVPLGAATRFWPTAFPKLVYLFAGDTLWATVVYLFIAFLRPAKTVGWLFFAAICFTFFIEMSQLAHFPWLEKLQATWLGFVILGHEFMWRDLVCYSAGILLGAGFDAFWRRFLPAKFSF